MKKTLPFLLLALLIFSCKKSAKSDLNANLTGGLSGMYVSYKSLDTTYINGKINNGINNIMLKSAYGDTLYQHPGTSNYIITPNIEQNYNPKLITSDTLVFTSDIAGIDVNSGATFPFSYSLKTGYYSDGTNDPSVFTKIIKIDNTKIETTIRQTSGNSVGDVVGIYYKKIK